MPTSWPPASFVWPPPQFTWLEVDPHSLDSSILGELKEAGFSLANPTGTERNTIFKNVLCDLGHSVTGRMLVGPDGARYPFAACNTNHDVTAGVLSRAVFFLWAPFYVNDFSV